MQSWQNDIFIGAEQKGDSLLISLQTQTPWKGKLFFDRKRHKENLNLPIDWPRINQFPEWFTAIEDRDYQVVGIDEKIVNEFKGSELINGIDIELSGNKKLVVY